MCRKMGLTPLDEDVHAYVNKISYYCKYCGASHPMQQFRQLQDNCKRRIRPRPDLIKLDIPPTSAAEVAQSGTLRTDA